MGKRDGVCGDGAISKCKDADWTGPALGLDLLAAVCAWPPPPWMFLLE